MRHYFNVLIIILDPVFKNSMARGHLQGQPESF